MVSELCQSRRKWIVPLSFQSDHSLCRKQESVAFLWKPMENTEKTCRSNSLILHLIDLTEDESCRTATNPSTMSCVICSLPPLQVSVPLQNQNPNLLKVPKFYVKRGCRTNKIQCSKSLLLCVRGAGETGERKTEKRRDRQTQRALIKHDCMIFQPQRGEHRKKAHSQSSSWGSVQGEGNSNL